ncbi:flavodoxin [candidate division WOR-3 bacterium]|nr:flavodoxin [candidate division WOR-3 bacterium]
MKTLLVVHSDRATGHTRRVAEAMAEELGAAVVDAEDANPALLAGYDLVGFGSGVYRGRLHPELHELARRLPSNPGFRAFIFSTAGTCCAAYHDTLRAELAGRGIEVTGEHACPGSDSYRFPGTVLNPERPTDDDLAAARDFARGLRDRLAGKD